MSPQRPVLVASDLSAGSDLAVSRGMVLAAAQQAPLVVLNAIEEEPLWWVLMSREVDADLVKADLRREALASLAEQIRQTADSQGMDSPSADARVRFGKPVEQVAGAGEDMQAALIVVGAHGRHAVNDWFVGTTAEKLVRASRRPVLLARIEPTHSYQHVVVGIDFSAASRAALVAALAQAPAAQVTLVHAYETWFESYLDPITYERLRSQHEDTLRDRLRDFAREAGVETRHEPDYRVVAGLPGKELVDTASRQHADLTVCGTRGETGLRHLLLGSVAQHVLRESKSDVLTVHPPAETD